MLLHCHFAPMQLFQFQKAVPALRILVLVLDHVFRHVLELSAQGLIEDNALGVDGRLVRQLLAEARHLPFQSHHLEIGVLLNLQYGSVALQ